MGKFTDIPVNFVGFFTVVCIQFVGIYGLFCAVDGRRAALPTLRQGLLSWAAAARLSFFVTKKGNEKSPAVARQRTPP